MELIPHPQPKLLLIQRSFAADSPLNPGEHGQRVLKRAGVLPVWTLADAKAAFICLLLALVSLGTPAEKKTFSWYQASLPAR